MKKVLMIAALALVSSSVFATPTVTEKEAQIGISGAFVPAGFDSSSDAYVVVNGVFQNGCYSWKRAEVNTTGEFTHEVKSIATVKQGMCIMVLIPFQKDIRIGKLPQGSHTLKFLNGDGTYLEKNLIVE